MHGFFAREQTRIVIFRTNITRDKNGRFLIVRFSLHDEDFCLVNIYIPNDQTAQVNVYNELTSKLPSPFYNENLILGGEFNCPLKSIDKKGKKDFNHSKIPSGYKINKMCRNLSLVVSLYTDV